jgi:hypothetical protein
MKESDARTDKYMELQEKYGDSDDAKEKIAREMGWVRELSEEEAEEESKRIEEINRACEEALDEPEPEPDPLTEGKDWIRTEDGDLRHPLQHRCFESAMKLWHECDELGLKDSEEDALHEFVFEFQTTSVNSRARSKAWPMAAIRAMRRSPWRISSAPSIISTNRRPRSKPSRPKNCCRQNRSPRRGRSCSRCARGYFS